jgi:hypothetical protein
VGDWQVLFLKERAIWHREAAKEAPEGRVLIVADDAHLSENLDRTALLVRELSESRDVKLLLSLRPGGTPIVESVLSRRFDPQQIVGIAELKQLSESEVRDIAEEVLGPDNQRYVGYLTAISKDAPLVTVVGGRLIARGSIDPRLLTGAQEFRRAVFGRFVQEIEVALSNRSLDFRSILHLASAVGPISFRSEPFLADSSAFLRLRPDEFLYGIDTLERRGLILRRGYRQRVVPDVLSDYLLEERCLNEAGESTGYAEAVYNAFRTTALSNVLRNLAELDWRITQQAPSASLLERVWQTITDEFMAAGATGRATLLKEIKPTAAYQPRPVMQVVRIAMDGPATPTEGEGLYSFGHEDVLRAIPPLLGIAYHAEFTEEAVRRLWRLAAADIRRANQFPEHALRLLKELASYERYKPVWFNLRVAEILESLVDERDAFAVEITPLDIVDALLEKEGDFTESVGLTLHLGGFELAYDVVRPARERALAIVEKCLYSQNGRKANRALKSVDVLIHGFLPKFGRSPSDGERKWQNEERLAALDLLKKRLSLSPVAIPLARQVYRMLSGFLRWALDGPVTQAVQEIVESISLQGELLEFHLLCSAPYDYHRRDEHWADSEKRWQSDLTNAVSSFRARNSDSDQQVDELFRMYALAEEFGIEIAGGRPFVNQLCADLQFRNTFTKRLLDSNVSSNVAYLIDPVLRQARLDDLNKYVELGKRIAAHPNVALVRGAAASFYPFEPGAGIRYDLALLDLFSRHNDRGVRWACIIGLQRLPYVLKQVSDPDQYVRATIQIALAIDLGADAELADELCDVFSRLHLGVDSLSEAEVPRFLAKLVPIDDLDK